MGYGKAQVSTQMSMKLLKGRDGAGGGKQKGSKPKLGLPEPLDSGAESRRVKNSKFIRGLPSGSEHNLLASLVTFKYLDTWYMGLLLYSCSALQVLEIGLTKPGPSKCSINARDEE